MIDKELESIGLSEKEAKVYLAALELGPSPMQDIAKKAGVNRATTYVIIEGLAKKGVFSSYEQGKKRFFVAEGPDSLKGVIRQQKEELERRSKRLEEMMSQLKSLHNLHPQKPVVKFYEGKEGIKTVAEKMFTSSDKHMDAVYPNELFDESFDQDDLIEIGKKRSNQGIKTREIYTDKRGDIEISEHLKGITERHRVSEDEYPFFAEINLADDKVMFATVKDFKCIMIENKDIAETMKSLFKLAWWAAKNLKK